MHAILPLSHNFLLPGSISELVIHSPIALTAVEYHLNTNKALLVLPQLTQSDYPKQEDIFLYGCSARILRCLDIDAHSKRILIEGLQRIRIESFVIEDGFAYLATPFAIQNKNTDEETFLFWQNKLKSVFTEGL